MAAAPIKGGSTTAGNAATQLPTAPVHVGGFPTLINIAVEPQLIAVKNTVLVVPVLTEPANPPFGKRLTLGMSVAPVIEIPRFLVAGRSWLGPGLDIAELSLGFQACASRGVRTDINARLAAIAERRNRRDPTATSRRRDIEIPRGVRVRRLATTATAAVADETRS
jgi:hypothetical protein